MAAREKEADRMALLILSDGIKIFWVMTFATLAQCEALAHQITPIEPEIQCVQHPKPIVRYASCIEIEGNDY